MVCPNDCVHHFHRQLEVLFDVHLSPRIGIMVRAELQLLTREPNTLYLRYYAFRTRLVVQLPLGAATVQRRPPNRMPLWSEGQWDLAAECVRRTSCIFAENWQRFWGRMLPDRVFQRLDQQLTHRRGAGAPVGAYTDFTAVLDRAIDADLLRLRV